MIKRMTMLVARRDRSPEAFRSYWLGKHADIARAMPKLAGYIQNHFIKRIDGLAADPGFRVDGMPELWFADEDAKTTAFASDAAKMLPVDEPNFIEGITIFAVEEIVVKDGKGAAKALVLLQPGATTDAEARKRWFATIADALPGVRRVVANHVLSGDHRPGVWHEPLPPDAMIELRFDSQDEAETALTGKDFKAAIEAAPGKPKAIAYLIEEHRIV
jgi:uncharacterized protein (TIGR02118 family)